MKAIIHDPVIETQQAQPKTAEPLICTEFVLPPIEDTGILTHAPRAPDEVPDYQYANYKPIPSSMGLAFLVGV